MKKFTISLGLILSMVTVTQAQEVGQPAPDFTLNKLGGGSFRLSDQQGKVVMIFMFGYNCHFCVTAGPQIEASLVTPYQNREDYVAIGADLWNGSQSGVESFRSSSSLSIPLLMQASTLATSYNTAHDRIIVVDKNGSIVFKNNGQAAENVLSEATTAINNALAESVNAIEDHEQAVRKPRVYPNPANEQTSISVNLTESARVQAAIYTLPGQLIATHQYGFIHEGANELPLELSNLPAGAYWLKVGINQEFTTLRLIRQ